MMIIVVTANSGGTFCRVLARLGRDARVRVSWPLSLLLHATAHMDLESGRVCVWPGPLPGSPPPSLSPLPLAPHLPQTANYQPMGPKRPLTDTSDTRPAREDEVWVLSKPQSAEEKCHAP